MRKEIRIKIKPDKAVEKQNPTNKDVYELLLDIHAELQDLKVRLPAQ